MLGTQLGGRPEPLIENISINSRNITPGDIFWALKGDRFDGHDFVSEAFKKGACGAVVSQDVDMGREDRFLIKTDNTLAALQKLGKHIRAMSSCQVVAVTGSSGKTCTKELIAHLLASNYEILKSPGNFNNHIGVPLTLIKIEPHHKYVVIEMGMNARGEIAYLTDLADPTIGIITNIGHAHIGLLGSREKIFKAKAELLKGMKKSGFVVLDHDSDYFSKLKREWPGKTITVGTSAKAHIWAKEITLMPYEKRMNFIMVMDKEEHFMTVPLLGERLVINVLMAIAVALECGLSMESIKNALSSFSLISGRMSIESFREINIIDDSYNANPESMRSSLTTLHKCKGNGRALAVLGDMLELGEQSRDLHYELGEWISKHIVLNTLILYGKCAQRIAEGAQTHGFAKDRLLYFHQREDIITFLTKTLRAGDWLLCKGSRAMRMEMIIEGLKQQL
ncbi:MAG: UDP-N-acetylmuramoyl-tripeptide--D-alanyl-D-alanine ligase [bacterium]